MMKHTCLAGLAGLLLISPFPSAVSAAQPEEIKALDSIVAVVEDDVILRSELDEKLNLVEQQLRTRNAPMPPQDVLEHQVLERMILTKLEMQRAESTGIRVTDEDVNKAIEQVAQQNNISVDQLREAVERDGFDFEAYRDNIRTEIATHQLRQRLIQARVQVSESEVDAVLARQGGISGQEVRLGHILISVPEAAGPDDIKKAQEKSDAVMAELNKGKDFAEAAITYSDGQQALNGGDLGWRSPNEVPTIFTELVETMKVGELAGPIRSPSGFHIVKLLDKREDTGHMVSQTLARHIMIRPTELISDDEARLRVQQIRDRIMAGESFEDMAREYSDDPLSASKGGQLDWFEPGRYGTAFDEAVAGLKKGEISQPFRTQVGWHIVQLLDRRQKDNTEELRREQARKAIYERKADETYETFLRRIRDEAYVEDKLAS